MLTRFTLLSTIVVAALSAVPAAAELPLAYSVAPPCSQRPGVRAVRSDLIQLGEVTASLSAQSTRENGSCVQAAALWVTLRGVSQQFELRDAPQNTFAIVDIAPDSSAILLSSTATLHKPDDYRSPQMAVLALPDGAVKWTPVTDVLGFKGCDALLEPEGFLDAGHILIDAVPPASAHGHASCIAKPSFYSFDALHHTVKLSATIGIRRFAQSVAPPLQSCKSDPDVVAACYTKRARLSLTEKGDGLLLWPVGEKRLLSVEDDMLPGDLLARVSPSMRVYATMVICPLTVEQPRSRPHICVDAATNLHTEAVPAKVHADVSGPAPAGVTGESH